MAVFKADQTLSFIAYKTGLLTGDGPACVGVLSLETLNVDAAYWAGQLKHSVHWRLESAPAWPERGASGHKGRFGQVSVLAGSPGMGGAGLLAARAALAAGAGKVVWHTDPENARTAMAVQPELMSADMDLSELPDSAVVVLGPGLGKGPEVTHICDALTGQARPGVLDADGLSWLAANPRPVSGWVLTPHPGEAAALLGITSTEVQADRCSAALALSQRFQTVVVLKGAGTIIAHRGQLWFSHPGTVAMATPGMGDTLAGWIGGLMAQSYSPWDAALSATWWHAASAAELARQQRVVLATDLFPLIQAAGMTRPDPDP
jgi:NAD(P)H-hydrate epimerase